MFITAVCVLFLIKLRWPRNKSLFDEARSTITLKKEHELLFKYKPSGPYKLK